MKRTTPSEEQIQIAAMDWARHMENQHPELRWLFHIPNGGSRHPAEARKLKRMGVKPGVPDLFLPVYRQNCAGLWIEVKSGTGKVRTAQNEWHEFLILEEYKVVVAHSTEEIINILCDYIGIKRPV